MHALLPLSTAAAARKSSIRLLVQEPMNTRSILTELSSVPGARSMYSSARCMVARRSVLAAAAGSGTTLPIAAASCGLVP